MGHHGPTLGESRPSLTKEGLSRCRTALWSSVGSEPGHEGGARLLEVVTTRSLNSRSGPPSKRADDRRLPRVGSARPNARSPGPLSMSERSLPGPS